MTGDPTLTNMHVTIRTFPEAEQQAAEAADVLEWILLEDAPIGTQTAAGYGDLDLENN